MSVVVVVVGGDGVVLVGTIRTVGTIVLVDAIKTVLIQITHCQRDFNNLRRIMWGDLGEHPERASGCS